MKYIADYLHNLGLKFVMYSDAGFYTCAVYPASYGYEIVDAQTFADRGIDYLKYDFGFFPTSADPATAYLTMAQALRMTGHDIGRGEKSRKMGKVERVSYISFNK